MNLVQVATIIGSNFARGRKVIKITSILLLFLSLLVCTTPAQAADRISPKLEEQILEVIRQHPEVIIESVQAYQAQQQQQIQQARQAFLNEIKTNPQAVIGESPTTGSADGKVVLVEFSDFQCPYCSEAYNTVKQFMDKHQDEVMLVYKHFPLGSIHPEAVAAAQAAWAADRQGKFWEYYDALFTNQDKLGEEFYLEIAQNLNLDLEKFDRDRLLADPSIQNDMQLATQLGISGTPFFVMNGQAFAGAIELDKLEQALASGN